MIVVRRAEDRFVTRSPGVETRHAFSFGAHWDPEHVAHGPVVLQDEHRLDSGAGFPPHPHRDLVVVSWVLDGVLVHEQDGRSTRVPAGSLQRMATGDGVVHAERADGVPTRFLQVWVVASGEEPAYEVAAAPDDAVAPLLGVQAGRLAAGAALAVPDAPHRLLHVVDGEVDVAGRRLAAGDSARLTGAGDLEVRGLRPARLLVV